MSQKFYTVEQLKALLGSPEISDEFRKRIEVALKDGSRSAIERLGVIIASAYYEIKLLKEIPNDKT